MKVRISECRLPLGHSKRDLEQKICRMLRQRQTPDYEIVRHAVDARKKPDLYDVYTIDVTAEHPESVVRRAKNSHVSAVEESVYRFPSPPKSPASDDRALRQKESDRPVIAGSGPAGLFCALMLSRAGLCPIVLERGESVENREKTVAEFWKSGRLDPSSNVQFGEGGAGTFSDGKLNTAIRDPEGRIRFVLQEFVRHGADPSILYEARPHIGTDELVNIVKNMREEILSLGGEVRFGSCLTGLKSLSKGKYLLSVNNGESTLETSHLVLAIGHSARDTLEMLFQAGLLMEPKSFAVGLRVEHPQSMINRELYGREDLADAPAASYRLTHKCGNGRGVYSFCMCPGGYVVNASSEPGMTAVNGMSYRNRGSRNANAAIVVTVTPQDCQKWQTGTSLPADDRGRIFAGISFQRLLEKRAYACAGGKIPVQRFEDFCADRPSCAPGSILPETKGLWAMANLREVLPKACSESIIEGMHAFSKTIRRFDDPDVLLSGVESRTSSPVRILRNERGECDGFPGIYPCGEGAGYAGGITSAAVDGVRMAECIVKKSMYISTQLC